MISLEINNNSIEQSFDRIAKQILLEKALYVNDKVFRITEIEFYYFYEKLHEDNYTHKHNRAVGEWRFHNQGIDITFGCNNKSDGGILIRGILNDDALPNEKYVNGPRKILMSIFEAFGRVDDKTTFVLKDGEKRNVSIIKTFRHLPNKIECSEYHNKHYRYLVDLESLKISQSIKDAIIKNYQVLE